MRKVGREGSQEKCKRFIRKVGKRAEKDKLSTGNLEGGKPGKNLYKRKKIHDEGRKWRKGGKRAGKEKINRKPGRLETRKRSKNL